MSKKELIFETSARMFMQRGFSASSIRDLAAEVKLEPSSIYSHVRSKEQLLYNVCLKSAEKFVNHIDELLKKELSVVDKMKELILFHIDISLDDPMSNIVFSDEWRHLTGDSLLAFKSLRTEYEEKFCGILNEGIAQGVFVNMESYLVMRTLVSSVRWLHEQKNYDTVKSKQLAKSNLRDLLMKGILI